jgi:hypothetical protein
MPLRNQLSDLAASFADSILEAIRESSLEELLAESGGRPSPKRGPGRPRGSGTKSGRLPRRSAEDIASELEKIVALVKKAKGGLRAEQIRTELGLQAKELPRVLKEGLASKVLKSKGQKRATTYTAA